ncbi:TolC family protein [Musicola keenii]|uniref:TolC family protein n=1 Tax=Musicola keenii TaxID=2884250 RepID=UPI001783E864|nr:TolC family protein [Musicola keenii]
MTRYAQLLSLVLTLSVLFGCQAETLSPSAPSRPGKAPVNMQRIDLSLGDAVYLALRDNRAIRSAYLDRIAQKFDLRVAEDRFTPKLMLSGSYLAERNQDDRYRQSDITPTTTLLTPYGTRVSLGWAYSHTRADQNGRSRNDGATISVIQPLLRGAGKNIGTAPVRLAQLTEQLNRLGLKLAVMQTITQTIESYRELLRSQEQLQITRDALARSRQLLDVNQALITAGRMAEFDIVQTQADVASQELSYEEASDQLERSRLALLQLLALDLNTSIRATETMSAAAVTVNADQALLEAEARQPAYLTQLIAGEQAQINLELARNNRLWDVSLVGGASQLRNRTDSMGSSQTWEKYVGVQVDIPIGDMTQRQAELQAQVAVKNQSLRQEEARQQLKRDVNNAVREIGTRWRQYEIARRALELSRRKLDIERQKLAVGRSSNFQVLSFEADLRTAENTRLNALISYLNTQATLDQTLGTTLDSWDISLND